MRQVSKNYTGFYANRKIDFNLKSGTIHAIAGENGAGKSTLMKMLFGLISPDHDGGEILVKGSKKVFTSPLDSINSGIGMVQQHFALSGVITPLENIILGAEPARFGIIDRKQALDSLQKLSGPELSVPWNEPTSQLAVGLQQRIEILKLLFRNADTLILDEPTGVLTPQEVTSFFHLLRKLKSEGRSIIIITHKIDEIMGLCDEVTVLRSGQVTGHFEIANLTKDKLIEAMIGRKLVKPQSRKRPLTKDGIPTLSVKNLSVEKKGRGSISNVEFNIDRGEILGVAGVEGNGQQALVGALLGIEKSKGQVIYKGKKIDFKKTNVRESLGFGLISEDRHQQSLWLEESIQNNCMIGISHQFSTFGFIRQSRALEFSKKILASYGVKMQSFSQPISSLSGGNQQKVVVAREVRGRKPEFLIASQPTRGVDVGAIEAIHNSILELAETGCGILLISSELEEICLLSDRVVTLAGGKITSEFKSKPFDLQKIGAAMTESQ